MMHGQKNIKLHVDGTSTLAASSS